MVFSDSVIALFMAVVTLGIASAVVAVVTLFMQRWRLERKLAAFPVAPDRHWLLGHLHKITFDEAELEWGRPIVEKTVYASVTWLGPFLPTVMVYHPDTVKAVLSTAEPKAEYTAAFVRPWIGDGLLLSSGKKWARNRRLLTPGFHFEILKPYVDIFQQSADILVEKWRDACAGKKKSMEMFHDISLLTLDSVLKCIFSVKTDCQTVVNHPYIKGIYDITNLVVKRVRFLLFHIDVIFNLSLSGWQFRHATNVVQSYARDIIKQRKQALKSDPGNSKTKQKKYVDFLDILLCAKDADGQGLTDQEIYDEVDTFLFEGHDTTSSGISWFLYNLARHPEYQQRCREEVDQLLAGKDGDKLQWDDLNNLPYLTQCLKESLRLHTAVPTIGRHLTRDVTLPDGRVLPKGTFVSVPINDLHNNSNVWPEPQTYDPDRFSPERAKTITPFAYVPFSAGPRNCIGQHFAMNEMKIITATILRNFYLSVNESIPVLRDVGLVLKSEKGIHLYAEPRKIQAP